jgi:hypothetical protein
MVRFITGVTDLAQYESIIQLAASLPNNSELREDLSGAFIKTLWSNLQHPPISYLGEEFKYRAADGSNNVRLSPELTVNQPGHDKINSS